MATDEEVKQEVDDSERLMLPADEAKRKKEQPKKVTPPKPAAEERKKIQREPDTCHVCNAKREEGTNVEPPFMATLVCSWCYKHEPRPENVKDKNAPKKDEEFYKSRVTFLTDFINVEQERMVKEQTAATEDEIKKIWGYKIDVVSDVKRSIEEILA